MREAVLRAARRIGAQPSDIPGLWNAPGYPELTTGQLLSLGAPDRSVTVYSIAEALVRKQ